MKRVIITIVVILGVGALIAWILTQNKQENEAKTAVVAETGSAVAVTAARVAKQPVDFSFSANGTFSPNQDLKLIAETSGRITSIQVQEGARVSKGQVLAHIDAELASLSVQQAEDQVSKLKTDVERYRSSFKTGGVSQSQLDEVELGLRNAENQLAQARRGLSNSYVRAPIAGIINKRNVEIGAFVGPSTELFEIVDVSRLKLDVTANESQVIQINKGDKVSITSNLFPDKEFTGTVGFVSVKADNSLSYPVEIIVDNPDTRVGLKPGMYATAHFKFPTQAPIILIPRSSFVGSVSSRQIYVLSDDSTAMLRDVTPGRIIGEQVEIISGLEEGETVITSGQINLADGMKVSAQLNEN